MGPLWVSADIPAGEIDRADEVMKALVDALREIMFVADVDPATAPLGTVTAHRFDLRRIGASPVVVYEVCNSEPDVVRFVVDYTG